MKRSCHLYNAISHTNFFNPFKQQVTTMSNFFHLFIGFNIFLILFPFPGYSADNLFDLSSKDFKNEEGNNREAKGNFQEDCY